MSRETGIIVAAVLLVALIYVIRYVLNYLMNKGIDAVGNKIRENRAQNAQNENLASRFQSTDSVSEKTVEESKK